MTVLMQVQLDFSNEIKKLDPEKYKKLQENIPEQFDKPQDEWSFLYNHFLIDQYQAQLLSDFDIGFSVKKFKGEMKVTPYTENGKSEQVHIHVPNVGLLFMTEVTWLENACTDELQKHLDEGWRILCVCPPNNQRRPDYILGRSKPQ